MSKNLAFCTTIMAKLKKNSLKLYMNGSPIDEKETTKYLGTFLDNKLTWKTQIEHIKLT